MSWGPEEQTRWLMDEYPGFKSRRVAECITVFRYLWPYDDGPGHIVYGDYNLLDSDLRYCIKLCDEGDTNSDDYPPGHPILAATKAVLLELLAIPEDERNDFGDEP